MADSKQTPAPYAHIGVIGAGAWGTALAMVAAGAGRRVTLWAHEAEVVAALNQARENSLFLPGIKMPPGLAATGDLAEAADAEALLLVAPAQLVRMMLTRLAPHLKKGVPLMLCAKGIERGTGKLLSEVLAEVTPMAEPAILSGPSFAGDVARGLPTAVTIAARADVAARLQASMGSASFRPYASDDVTGVALGGAAKNVYAIACGVVDGLGLGESARAALLARGFAELARLGEALGAKRETLMGLSGLGDLVLTATSVSSRNFSFGLALGRRTSLDELRQPGHPLAEGVETAPALVARGHAMGVELPIAEAMADLLERKLPLGEALARLMTRRLKAE
ncbi:MAG TPA: NAD(P)H-dependent glycerol-3-phosphate dehydrogenase [Rhizomicrobium sp.]